MKDDEDVIIDLVFYCVGCNIVDILGMVGELRPTVNLIFISRVFCLGLCFLAPCHPGIVSRKHWGALHPPDTRPAQAQDWLPQVSFLCATLSHRDAKSNLNGTDANLAPKN